MAAASESAGTSRKAAVSFTGGKDSMLVLHLMQAPEVALQTTFNNDAWGADVQQRVTQVSGCEVALLVTFVPAGEKQSFKAHPLKVVYQQARRDKPASFLLSMPFQLIFWPSHGTQTLCRTP